MYVDLERDVAGILEWGWTLMLPIAEMDVRGQVNMGLRLRYPRRELPVHQMADVK